ncbi:hypothetical protein FWD07_01240 [Candidatus Saccharibacteria bacterium]|nr:hypothetical protein [Candidatus Saccharibacteria bacterium]
MFEAYDANGVTRQYHSISDCASANLPPLITNVHARESIDPNQFFASFSPQNRRLALSHLYAIGLTNGCNGRCDFCGEASQPGITKQLTYESTAGLIREFLADPDIDCCTKACFVLHAGSDPLDYIELSPSGHNTYDIFSFLKIRHHPCSHFPITQDVTHIPIHASKALLQYYTKVFTNFYKDGKRLRPRNLIDSQPQLIVSVTDRNAEMVRTLIDELIDSLMRNLKIHTQGPAAREKFRKEFIAHYATGLFADKTTTGDFFGRPLSVNIRNWMTHVGRNFPEDPDFPIESTIVHWRTGEGTIIIPEGLLTVINVLPTTKTPRGRLEFPILPEQSIFRKTATLSFEHAVRDNRRDALLILPSLRDSLVGDGDASHILTIENELLREAYCLRMFANNITVCTPISFIQTIRTQLDRYEEIKIRIATSEQIAKDSPDGRIRDFVLKAVGETYHMLDLCTTNSTKELCSFFVTTQSGYCVPYTHAMLDAWQVFHSITS